MLSNVCGNKLINAIGGVLLLSYLNQGEYFILNNGRWVVFRRDDFDKYSINKVPASDQSMKPMAAVLHTCLQDLMDAERKY